MLIKIYDKLPDEAKKIREKVFINEQGFSYDYDEIDDTATHLVIFSDTLPVGTCRIFEDSKDGAYILGRLAVKKELRQRGIGSQLVDAAKKYVQDIGAKSLILHSQLHAKDFYSKLGFKEYGEIEYEEDCPHIWMKYDFKR